MRQRKGPCSVPGCINIKTNPEISVFTLPKDPDRAQCWLDQIRVKVQPNELILVCEEHFEEVLINKLDPKAIFLDNDAVPTLKLPFSKQLDITVFLPSSSNTNEQPFLADSSETGKRKNCIRDYTRSSKKIKPETYMQKEESQPSKPTTDVGSVLFEEGIETTLNLNDNISLDDSDTESKEKADNVEFISVKDTNDEHDFAMRETDCSLIKISNDAITKTTQHKIELNEPDNKPETHVKLYKIYSQIENAALSLKAYKQLSLRLYLRFPNEYKTLYKALNTLHKSELKDVFNDSQITIDEQNLFGIYLNLKVSTMSVQQKQCFLSIGEFKIKPRFYYDIRKDHIFGTDNLDKELKMEPATTAIVLIIQGIFDEWKQPISVAYLANNQSIRPWIKKLIKRISDMGFKVRALVPHRNMNYDIQDLNLTVTKNKIDCFHDVSSLFINLYYHFTKYDFIICWNNSKYEIKIITCKHIVDCFAREKKSKGVSLMSKLSEKLLKPARIQELSIESVMNVFSMSTAAAISANIGSIILDEESAQETILFITKMNKLYDILNTGALGDKRNGYVGDQSDIDYLRDMLTLLSNMKLNIQSNSACGSFKALIKKFKILISSVLSLSSSLKNENYSYLPIWRFTDDAIDLFFNNVQKQSKSITKPTAKNVDSIFNQTAVIHLLKNHAKKIKPNDLDEVLTKFDEIVVNFKFLDTMPLESVPNFKISSSEYMGLDMERKDGIIFLAGFLLKKCNDIHKCWFLKDYNSTMSIDLELLSMCESIMDDVRKNICSLPGKDLIEFVETMEIIFRTFINNAVLGGSNMRVLKTLLLRLVAVNVNLPCSCFPITYMKKLYIRFRIYHTLKYNNELLKTKLRKQLVVNKL